MSCAKVSAIPLTLAVRQSPLLILCTPSNVKVKPSTVLIPAQPKAGASQRDLRAKRVIRVSSSLLEVCVRANSNTVKSNHLFSTTDDVIISRYASRSCFWGACRSCFIFQLQKHPKVHAVMPFNSLPINSLPIKLEPVVAVLIGKRIVHGIAVLVRTTVTRRTRWCTRPSHYLTLTVCATGDRHNFWDKKN